MFHFQRQAAPELKAILSEKVDALPPRLATLLEKLRDETAPKGQQHKVDQLSRR
jgi:hypothetical protein